MIEFDSSGQTYRTGTLNAKVAFHIARRIMPAYASMGVGATSLHPIERVALALAKLEQGDADYIINHCLSVAQRQDSGRWAQVAAGPTVALAYADMTFVDLISIAKETLGEQILPFFPDLLGVIFGSPAQAPQAT